jgi:hypothetical protein
MPPLRIASLLALLAITAFDCQAQRWSEQRAREWYARQPWLAGANYIPATAINQLEMWQAATFDPATIDRELGWAHDIGMNTMRVFLHDLLWQQDAPGFQRRLGQFLEIASRRGIKPMLVLFDSCWDPFPQPGKQRAPKPGIHNSGWVQSPGAKALSDPAHQRRLEAYVRGVIGAFGNDQRVLGWDIWNEPDNTNASSYGKSELPNKVALVQALLPKVFSWARAAKPGQPVTCGLWQGDWSSAQKLSAIDRMIVENCDIISFHNYNDPKEFARRIQWLQRYRRPILCTEYMARGNQSTFQGIMPVAAAKDVAVYNWGLVAGKAQTNLPWDSWQRPYVDREPEVWFHEIFRASGKPYRQEEVEFIRKITAQQAARRKPRP